MVSHLRGGSSRKKRRRAERRYTVFDSGTRYGLGLMLYDVPDDPGCRASRRIVPRYTRLAGLAPNVGTPRAAWAALSCRLGAPAACIRPGGARCRPIVGRQSAVGGLGTRPKGVYLS